MAKTYFASAGKAARRRTATAKTRTILEQTIFQASEMMINQRTTQAYIRNLRVMQITKWKDREAFWPKGRFWRCVDTTVERIWALFSNILKFSSIISSTFCLI